MPRKVDKDYCFGCEVVLSKKATEHHHFPMPKRVGGKDTVALCMSCHDMVDRVNLEDWPVDWAFAAVNGLNRECKLFLMKAMSKFWPDEN